MNEEKWFDNEKGLSVHEIVKLESEYRIDSLVCAVEEILSRKDDNEIDINEEELVVLAVESMEREVNNGGFEQFFGNYSWRFSPYLVVCLNRIGSTQAKQLAEQAISALGIGKLSDVNEYYQSIQKVISDDGILEKLGDIDSRYYEMNENIADLVFNFIKNNISSFDNA